MSDFSWLSFIGAASGAIVGSMISRKIREWRKPKPKTFKWSGPNVEKLRRETKEADMECQFSQQEEEIKQLRSAMKKVLCNLRSFDLKESDAPASASLHIETATTIAQEAIGGVVCFYCGSPAEGENGVYWCKDDACGWKLMAG